MSIEVDSLLKAQVLLEEGFQECLDLTADLQHKTIDNVRNKTGFQALSDREIVEHLSKFSGDLYESMARTLFRLIGVCQPEDCNGSRPINFYFWPGYHSYLFHRRIFITRSFIHDGPWNLGVGIYGTPQAKTLDSYDDCSQARWYQYLIKPRNASAAVPIDIHRKFLQEQNSASNARSLMVTTQASEHEEKSQPHPFLRILRLPSASAGTEAWGKLLINLIEGGKSKETQDPLSAAKAKMHSLWLHTAFCNYEPEWLPGFIEALGARADTAAASQSLNDALKDEVAKDWGDKSTGRPPFCSWINISLRAWLDPEMLTAPEDQSSADKSDKLARKTVGSVGLLCSMPLSSGYFGLARSWANEVYNTVRSAEIGIRFRNQDRAAREAMLAGPYFAHEIQKIVDQTLATAQRDFADNGQQAIETRRFVLYSIRTLCNLAYSCADAVLSRDKNALKEQTREFIQPLQKLRQDGVLLPDLNGIAKEIYNSVKRRDGGTVAFPDNGHMPVRPNEKQHGACFLLVAEMLRNYCQSQEAGFEARFRPQLDADTLTIELDGPTSAQRNPASMTFARLDVFLRTLGIGKASTCWNKDKGSCRFTVTVDLGPQIPEPTI